MKSIFCSIVLVSIIISNSWAQEDLSSKKNELLLGINITQCMVGDFELHVMYSIKSKHAFTIAAGYDKNFLDFGRHWPEDKQGHLESVEQESNDEGRYFWGNGPAGRFIYDYNFPRKANRSNYFLSATLIVKEHNYKNYFFGDRGTSRSESGNQRIYGLTMCGGKNFNTSHCVFRFYVGVGIRHLESSLSWPGYNRNGTLLPAKDFNYSLTAPSLDFGIVFYFRTRALKD